MRERLSDAHAEALGSMVRRRHAVAALADALVERDALDAEEIADVVPIHPERKPVP